MGTWVYGSVKKEQVLGQLWVHEVSHSFVVKTVNTILGSAWFCYAYVERNKFSKFDGTQVQLKDYHADSSLKV